MIDLYSYNGLLHCRNKSLHMCIIWTEPVLLVVFELSGGGKGANLDSLPANCFRSSKGCGKCLQDRTRSYTL